MNNKCHNIYCNGVSIKPYNYIFNKIIESLCNRINLKICCKWSLYYIYNIMNINLDNLIRYPCSNYDNCNRIDIYHIVNFSHLNDE